MNKVTIGRRDRGDGQQVAAAKGVYKDFMVFNRPFTASQMISLYTEQLYSRM
jgi:hypothetical protein